MTQTVDIDTMEPGREMDALVAERVMGYRWIKPKETVYRVLVDPATSDDAIWFYAPGPNDCVPHFSTDIAATWEVVEHINAGAPSPLFYRFRNYLAEVGLIELFDLSADGAACAVCRAALKAVSQ